MANSTSGPGLRHDLRHDLVSHRLRHLLRVLCGLGRGEVLLHLHKRRARLVAERVDLLGVTVPLLSPHCRVTGKSLQVLHRMSNDAALP